MEVHECPTNHNICGVLFDVLGGETELISRFTVHFFINSWVQPMHTKVNGGLGEKMHRRRESIKEFVKLKSFTKSFSEINRKDKKYEILTVDDDPINQVCI